MKICQNVKCQKVTHVRTWFELGTDLVRVRCGVKMILQFWNIFQNVRNIKNSKHFNNAIF